MRKVIGLAVVSMFVLGVSNIAFAAEAENKEPPKEGHGCLMHMAANKDVKYEVTNIANGVTITITSDKPDVVKLIQESNAKCHEAHKSGDHKNLCPMKSKDNPQCHHEHDEKQQK